jgi:hypothetical protein
MPFGHAEAQMLRKNTYELFSAFRQRMTLKPSKRPTSAAPGTAGVNASTAATQALQNVI